MESDSSCAAAHHEPPLGTALHVNVTVVPEHGLQHDNGSSSCMGFISEKLHTQVLLAL